MPVGAEPTRAEIEASEWLVLLDAPALPQAEIERFQAWLAASAENQRAYAAVCETWDKIAPVLAALPRAAREPPTRHADDQQRAPSRFRRARLAVGAGALIAACLALLLLAPLPEGPAFSPSAAYATAAREQRTITLADGTLVQLSPLARLSVAFENNERRVVLSSGAALFNVSPDIDRPFVVATRFGQVRAQASSFAVRISEDAAHATVMQGQITASMRRGRSLLARLKAELSPENATSGQELCLRANALQIETLTPALLDSRLGWRQGKVVIDDASLRDAALEVTRFSGVHFVFADPRLADTRVTGYFEGGDVDGFLAALRANFDIQSQRDGERIILHR